MQTRHRIEIAREQFKFSCAHMTVFPDGSKERLHGHNYYIGIALELSRVEFADMVPFGAIKEAILGLCREWREHLLLAADNPFLEMVADTADELEFRLCGARYVVPRGDAIILPIDNVTVEALAGHVSDLLIARLESVLAGEVVTQLEVTVSENPGQGARHIRSVK